MHQPLTVFVKKDNDVLGLASTSYWYTMGYPLKLYLFKDFRNISIKCKI